MKKSIVIVAGLLLAGGILPAQQWEVGVTGGAGFLKGLPVKNGPGSATASFAPGGAIGAYVGQNLYKHLSGEFHYDYLQSVPQLKSGGTTVKFAGSSHLVHFDMILHTAPKGRVQAFVAAGGGMRQFRSTGKEVPYQPLQQYAVFTVANQTKPMGDFGGGLKFQISKNVYLRTEFRDYITMFPKNVITPVPGSKVSGLLHDFVPMAGLSIMF